MTTLEEMIKEDVKKEVSKLEKKIESILLDWQLREWKRLDQRSTIIGAEVNSDI